jgi:DNA helicase-2/ATP-dependent DNA helicase PcrA
VAEAVGGAGAGGRSKALPTARVEAEIGWAKARLLRPDAYVDGVRSAGRRVAVPLPSVAEAYRRYEELRRRRGVLDLDDLLVSCADVLADDSSFAAAVRWRYRHLYVDEMQDVNPAQFRLLCALLGDEPDLFVVGDPHQSVYGWNGADPGLLESFPTVFAGTRVVRLDRNHRSSPQVVAVAGAALGVSSIEGVAGDRAGGPLPELAAFDSDADEAKWVARRVWRDHPAGGSWTRVAVLTRTNAQLPVVAAAFERERVPYRIAGSDLSPASDVGRGGGAGSAGASRAGGAAGSAGASRAGGAAGSAGSAGSERGGRLYGADRDEVEEADDAEVADEVDGHDGAAVEPSVKAFESEDGVVLSTFHKAKGLEWSSVFVIGLSEGLVPLGSARSEEALAEERRLLYVAMTRAEERLHLSWARRPEGEGGGADRKPCRWLAAVEDALHELRAAAEPTDPAETVARLSALREQVAAARAADRR